MTDQTAPEPTSHIEAVSQLVDPAGLAVLDVGAGDGSFLAQLTARGARASGLEVDAGRVERAARKGAGDIRLGRAEALPFEAQNFDLVTFIHSFHHVPVACHAAALKEAARVLRPGGHLMVAEPEIDSDMTRIVAAVEDETEVRQAALASLAVLPQREGFELRSESGYLLTRRYGDFSDLVAAVVSVDPARARAFPAAEDEMKKRFDRYARRREDSFEVHQSVRLMHFRLSVG